MNGTHRILIGDVLTGLATLPVLRAESVRSLVALEGAQATVQNLHASNGDGGHPVGMGGSKVLPVGGVLSTNALDLQDQSGLLSLQDQMGQAAFKKRDREILGDLGAVSWRAIWSRGRVNAVSDSEPRTHRFQRFVGGEGEGDSENKARRGPARLPLLAALDTSLPVNQTGEVGDLCFSKGVNHRSIVPCK